MSSSKLTADSPTVRIRCAIISTAPVCFRWGSGGAEVKHAGVMHSFPQLMTGEKYTQHNLLENQWNKI